MRKEELRRLKRINATPKMRRMAENNHKIMKYKSKYSNSYIKRKTEYDLFVRCQNRGKYLMICIFFPERVEAGEMSPTYEIYCNPEGDEYLTRVIDKGREIKWSNAMADNLGQVFAHMISSYGCEKTEKRIWQNPEGAETIRQILKTNKKGLWGLIEWQKKVREMKIKEAEKREQAPWDADMALIPDILPSFKDWMKKEAPREYFIFYEYSKNGAAQGYCSHCMKMVPIKNPKHNVEGRCSKCGVKIQFKASGKIKTLMTEKYSGQFIQKIKGGIVIRTFTQQQWYINMDYRNPDSYLNEIERILILDNNTVKRYYYGLYKNKKHRFIPDESYMPLRTKFCYLSNIKLYKRNLNCFKKTILKNSSITLWNTLPITVDRYLAIEREHPVVEKLAKLGMFRLAADLIDSYYDDEIINEDETELTKILKIDTSRLKRLKVMNGKIEHLIWYQYEKQINSILPDEMIKDFGNCSFEPSSFNFLPLHLSLIKIWNYMKKQSALSGESLKRVRDTWRDYINMAKQAKMNVKSDMICKPKVLKAAHNEMVMILQSGEMEKQAEKLTGKWPKVNDNLPKLKKFEYTDGKYSIIAPNSIIDIVKEGTALQHCVHTCDFYFDRIQRDETYLFFLRKSECEDVPWYTLEVEPNGNIRQKRTTGDNQNKDFDEAVKFLKKWQKVFVKRMTEADKELGIKADQARIEEYAKLRKDGNRVWHGRLAGQLLADVLENDFMAAVM